jgi:hypothetical protein
VSQCTGADSHIEPQAFDYARKHCFSEVRTGIAIPVRLRAIVDTAWSPAQAVSWICSSSWGGISSRSGDATQLP